MGKPEEPVDESKVSFALIRKMMHEQSQAATQMQEQAAKQSQAKFARSFFGKRWIPIREQLKKTKSGRRWLFAITTGRSVFWIALLLLAPLGVSYAFENWIFPPDYRLTSAQQAEGYGQTITSGKSHSPEHVYVRFYEDKDYKTHSECGFQYDWCVFAIPAYKDCEEIYMEFSTKEKSGDLEPTVERLTTFIDAPPNEFFPLGVPQTLGITTKSSKSQYGSVDHIYCRGK